MTARRRPVRAALRRVPAIARRDRRIATLQARLSGSSESVSRRPSFQARLFAERRIRAHQREADPHTPSVISRGKFWVYDFVRSHGVEVPRQHGRWDEPEQIAWDELPDRAVVKANRGSTGQGVLPVQRVGDGWRVITHDAVVEAEALAAELRSRVNRGQIAGPFGAEEFLHDPDDPESIACEVKAYTFYGEVPLLQVTRSVEHGNLGRTQYRFVDARGTDLISPDTHPALDPAVGVDPANRLDLINLSIPLPPRLAEAAEVAARLSLLMRLPFARIDVYPLADRVVFGEVTPRPGGRQWLGLELDTRLGECWERAQARFANDLVAGMSPLPEPGPHHDGLGDPPLGPLG